MHGATIKINLSTVICSDDTSPFVVQYQLYSQYTDVHNFTSEYGNTYRFIFHQALIYELSWIFITASRNEISTVTNNETVKHWEIKHEASIDV